MTPDELCPHVELGAAEQVGGIYFEESQIAVAMCARCLGFCQQEFETLKPMERSNATDSTGEA